MISRHGDYAASRAKRSAADVTAFSRLLRRSVRRSHCPIRSCASSRSATSISARRIGMRSSTTWLWRRARCRTAAAALCSTAFFRRSSIKLDRAHAAHRHRVSATRPRSSSAFASVRFSDVRRGGRDRASGEPCWGGPRTMDRREAPRQSRIRRLRRTAPGPRRRS